MNQRDSPRSSDRPDRPVGVLDSVVALGSASLNTAVELVAQGPSLVRATASVAPLAADALRALPRFVALLEDLTPVATGLQATVQDVAPDLHRLAGAVGSLDRLAQAVDPLDRLADAVPTLRTLAEVVPALRTLATLDEDLHRLAGATVDVHTLSEATPVIERLAEVVPAVEALAGATGHAERLAGAVPELEKLTAAIAHVEVLARHAEETFPELPPRLQNLDDALSTAAGELEKVTPDLRTVASRIHDLDSQIKVLADALAPLQGTTERLGRLVDRLPRGRPRAVES